MKYPCTGVILAGGLNTRFSGRDKALISVGGKNILDRILGVFKDLFEEIILVTNDPLQYLSRDLLIATDFYPIRSSLTGIHTGLFLSSNPYAFLTASDTPFLKKQVVETILEGIEPGIDAIMPQTPGGLEPLCAVYSKQCLPAIEQHLAQQKLKIQRVFRKNQIKKIPETVLRQNDPDLLSFFNINTPEDLVRAEAIEIENRNAGKPV